MLPQIAQGDSNKIWIIPSEFANALGSVGKMLAPGEPTDTDRSPDKP